MPANQPPRLMAPALPVFAGEPAPTGTASALNYSAIPVGAGLPAIASVQALRIQRTAPTASGYQ
ncbi:hypothetical protein CR511_00325 [Pseudomonas putida]|nr:hypothetical protein CR511_00325 [Pseudomonas putida]